MPPTQAPAPTSRTITLCRYCGVVAPAANMAGACEICRRPLAETAIAVDDSGEAFWVAVRARFQCSACEFQSPLDSLDVDGAVACAHCGVERRFEPESWAEPLAFAHAVGDLAGPFPEGRAPGPHVYIGADNPHREVGATKTFGFLDQTGFEYVRGVRVSRAIEFWASPGHPVCSRCAVPMRVDAGTGGATSTCAQCGESAAYAFDERARGFAPGLVLAIAEALRTDRRTMNAGTTGDGPSAFACPTCGAPLSVEGNERTVRCKFCSASCRVPARALVRTAGAEIAPETWWILFRGPSAARHALENPEDSGSGGVAKGKGAKGGGLKEARMLPASKVKQLALTVGFAALALLIGFAIAPNDGPGTDIGGTLAAATGTSGTAALLRAALPGVVTAPTARVPAAPATPVPGKNAPQHHGGAGQSGLK